MVTALQGAERSFVAIASLVLAACGQPGAPRATPSAVQSSATPSAVQSPVTPVPVQNLAAPSAAASQTRDEEKDMFSFQITVEHPKEFVAGFPMFVALTFRWHAGSTPDAIRVLDELDPDNVWTRWVRAPDGTATERGGFRPGARSDWYRPVPFDELREGPIPAPRQPVPSIRLREAPRRFLTSIGDFPVGCYAVSLNVGYPAQPRPFDVCVRAPTAHESFVLKRILALAPPTELADTRAWRIWMESAAFPDSLPIAGGDPIAYLRLERYVRHGRRPLPPITDAQFDAIDPFYAPETMVLRVLAAAARDDDDAFFRIAKHAEATVPEKWLDLQRARGLFAIRSGDKAALEAAIAALWDEHHQWAKDLHARWRAKHPDDPVERPQR